MKRELLLFFAWLLWTAPATQAQLTYTTNNGALTVAGFTMFQNNVIIPSSVNGLPVTSIGNFVFSADTMAFVTIPNSVTNIGAQAFAFCDNLAFVTMGNSVMNIGDLAFYECPSLTAVYFAGNAPNLGSMVFDTDTSATAYYLPGTGGWGPTLDVLPTALWTLPYPTILNSSSGLGAQAAGFSFTISWATNLSVVVEACGDLSNPAWQPLQTNGLNNGTFYFNDPQWTSYPARFYRVRSLSGM